MALSIEARRLRGIELSLIRRMMQIAPPDAINLALGELGYALPATLRDKAIELLRDSTPVYTPNAGLPALREAIAAQYPGSGESLVCVCNGVEEAAFVTLLSLLDPGDTVAIPDPDYTAYPAICKILEANVLRLPFESDLSTVDWGRWESLLAPDVKALLLSHPSNPCGHVFSEVEADRLKDLCRRNGILLIVDEIYARLYFSSRPASFWDPAAADGLIMLGGLSKSHCMSGWRLGWVLAPPGISGSIVKTRQYVSTCSNWLSQKLAEFALSAQGLEAADEVLCQLKASRSVVIQSWGALAERVILPQASPYLILRVGGDEVAVASQLAARGVITVPGNAFGEVAKGWLRINYAVPQPKLERALEIITDELHLH